MLILKIIATLCEMFLLIVIHTIIKKDEFGDACWYDFLIYGVVFLTILIAIWV